MDEIPIPGYAMSEMIVDLGALERNYAACRSVAGSAECGAVVKADAYGLGIGPVVGKLLEAGCETFFVATVSEAVSLRELAPDSRIFVFEGPVVGSEPTFESFALSPVLNSLAQCRRWSDVVATGATAMPAAIHVDTGMGRLGLTLDAIDTLAKDPGMVERISPAYLMTHLACADQPEHALNRIQIDRFTGIRRKFPDMPVSIANSAGLMLGPDWHGDLVRPGIALYGASPTHKPADALEEVVEVRAPILQIRTQHEAATVGYGATWTGAAGKRLATVAAGYADGYPRSLSNRGLAIAANQRINVAGRVSMDLTTFDISDVADGALAVGDQVTLIGNGVQIDELANQAGTIAYELLTSLGPRYRRVYSGA
jgi:alanine racemase